MTSIDIESTLQRVCTKVTHDNFVSAEARLARKRGLIRLGEIFSERAQEHLPKGGIEEVLNEVPPHRIDSTDERTDEQLHHPATTAA
jgi:hypothetical protein